MCNHKAEQEPGAGLTSNGPKSGTGMLLDAGDPHYLAVLRISATLTGSPGRQGKLTKYGVLFAKDYFGQDPVRLLECAISTEYESQLRAEAAQEQRRASNATHVFKTGVWEQTCEAGQDQDCPDDDMRGNKRKRHDDKGDWQTLESNRLSDKVKAASKSGWWLYAKAAIYVYDGSSETATQDQPTDLQQSTFLDSSVLDEAEAGDGGFVPNLTVPGPYIGQASVGCSSKHTTPAKLLPQAAAWFSQTQCSNPVPFPEPATLERLDSTVVNAADNQPNYLQYVGPSSAEKQPTNAQAHTQLDSPILTEQQHVEEVVSCLADKLQSMPSLSASEQGQWEGKLHVLFHELIQGTLGTGEDGADKLEARYQELGIAIKIWSPECVEPKDKKKQFSGRSCLMLVCWNWAAGNSKWTPPGCSTPEDVGCLKVPFEVRAQQVNAIVALAKRQGASDHEVSRWLKANSKAVNTAVVGRAEPVVAALLSHMKGWPVEDRLLMSGTERQSKRNAYHEACWRITKRPETEEEMYRQSKIRDLLMDFFFDGLQQKCNSPIPDLLNAMGHIIEKMVHAGVTGKDKNQFDASRLLDAFNKLKNKKVTQAQGIASWGLSQPNQQMFEDDDLDELLHILADEDESNWQPE